MYIPLDLTNTTWHFKRAARKIDGSPHETWSSQLETTTACSSEGRFSEAFGQDDPRLDIWMPVNVIPHDPFLLLQNLGIIPDPAVGMNEDKVQCE